jgi:hypothetical protein
MNGIPRQPPWPTANFIVAGQARQLLSRVVELDPG